MQPMPFGYLQVYANTRARILDAATNKLYYKGEPLPACAFAIRATTLTLHRVYASSARLPGCTA